MSAEPLPDQLLVFPMAVEVFFKKTLGNQMTPELKRALREAGLDLDKPFLPAYPAADMARWGKLAARTLHPDVDAETGLERFGEPGLDAWEQTIVGKATLVGMKLLGPRRLLQRIGKTFRYSDNFTQVEYVEEAPNQVRLIFNHFGFVAGQRIGIIAAVLRRIGLQDVHLELIERRGEGGVVSVRWR